MACAMNQLKSWKSKKNKKNKNEKAKTNFLAGEGLQGHPGVCTRLIH